MTILRTWLKGLLKSNGYYVIRSDTKWLPQAAMSIARLAGIPGTDKALLVESANKVGYLACLGELLTSENIDLVLDVGAYEGQFAQCLRGVGYNGRIVSFEPNPEVLEDLKILATKDGDWSVFDCGLGCVRGKAELTSFNTPSFASTKQINARARTRFGEMVQAKNVYSVSVRTLAEVVEELRIRPELSRAMLKVDTQGADLEVLEGANDLLSEFRIVQVEAAIQPLYEGAPQLDDFVSLLSRHGFQLSHISGISHEPRGLAILEADCIFCRSPKP